MPAIFISHSSLDQRVADEIKASLARLGFERVFLDFDKDTGLGAGDNWEQRLYEEQAARKNCDPPPPLQLPN